MLSELSGTNLGFPITSIQSYISHSAALHFLTYMMGELDQISGP